MRTLTKQEAENEGYHLLAGPYHEKYERDWMNAVLADCRECDVVLVKARVGLEIWRHDSEWDTLIKRERATRNLKP